jgi:hypothetical protein
LFKDKDWSAKGASGKTPPFTETVRLTRADQTDHPMQKGLMVGVKVVKVQLKAGTTYTIDLINPSFNRNDAFSPDPFIVLEDPSGKQVGFDDDGGGFPNARLVFTPKSDGEYRILCTTWNSNAYGDLTLKVSVQGR